MDRLTCASPVMCSFAEEFDRAEERPANATAFDSAHSMVADNEGTMASETNHQYLEAQHERGKTRATIDCV